MLASCFSKMPPVPPCTLPLILPSKSSPSRPLILTMACTKCLLKSKPRAPIHSTILKDQLSTTLTLIVIYNSEITLVSHKSSAKETFPPKPDGEYLATHPGPGQRGLTTTASRGKMMGSSRQHTWKTFLMACARVRLLCAPYH